MRNCVSLQEKSEGQQTNTFQGLNSSLLGGSVLLLVSVSFLLHFFFQLIFTAFIILFKLHFVNCFLNKA